MNLKEYNDEIITFIDWYYKDEWDLAKMKKIVKEYNFDDYILNSRDFELIEVSYEYNFSCKTYNDDFRIALFWLKLDFIEIFKQNFCDYNFNLDLLKKFYFDAWDKLKEKYISISFTFDKDYKLSWMKIYFDTFILDNNDILYNFYPSKFIKLIKWYTSFALASMTITQKEILDFKLYIPTTKYFTKIADILLKDNLEYQKFKDFTSFDILFRFCDDKKTIKSVKLYYELRYNSWLRELISQKYFSWLFKNNLKINSRDEVWIDFHLKWGINKINYYIWLFKN